MLFRLPTALLSLVAVATGQLVPWNGSRFEEAEIRPLRADEIYPRGDGPRPLTVDATIVYVRGTSWTEARAVRQIRKTAEIFRACRVGFGEVRLARVSLPKRLRNIDVEAIEVESGVPANVRAISEMLPADTPYPVAFLIGRVEGEDSLARSYRSEQPGRGRAPYVDTSWIGYRAHWIVRKDERYSPLAHEFAHLLCRCGHTKTPSRHLLHSARNFLSSSVLPEHCEAIRRSLFVSSRD